MFMNENSAGITPNPVKNYNNLNSKVTPVPFWLIVSMLDDGMTEEQILKQYPSLSCAEIKAAVKYAESTAV